MNDFNYGYMLAGSIMWAIGLLLLVEAVRTQWTGGMTAMVFVYYLVGILLLGVGCVKFCMKGMCMHGMPAPAKKAA